MKEKILLIVLVIGMLTASVSALDEASFLCTEAKSLKYTSPANPAAVWGTVHDATSAGYFDASNCFARIHTAYTSNLWDELYRGYIIFNTSSIPEDVTIVNGWIRLAAIGIEHEDLTSGTEELQIVEFNPENPSSVALTDFDLFGTEVLASDLLTDIPDGDGVIYYMNITSYEFVNTEGLTCIGLRLKSDVDDNPPVWQANKMNYADTAPTTATNDYKAQLTLVWTTASADIDVSPSSGNLPLEVTFTDDSSGFPESVPYATYSLSFGDGSYWDGDWQYSGENWFHTYHYAGTYNYSYAITDDGMTYYSNGTVTVTDTDSNFYVEVHGLNTSAIEGANVTIWYDGVEQDWEGSSSIGRAYFDVPANRWVNGTVTKAGYQTASYSQYISTWDTWKSVTLYEDDETPGTGDEYWNYIVTFRDANTLETLTNVFIDVYTDSGRTDLYTSENAPYGVWTGLLPNDTIFYFTASAENHITANWSYTLSGASISVYKDLIPVTYGSLQPVLNIFVYDTGGTPLKDVGVTVDSDIDDGFHLTNVTGYARHFCDNLAYGSHRNYIITAEKGGYVTESSSVNVSTQQPTVYIFLEKSTVATVTQTGIYTPVVTPVWSGDGGTPGNIKEQVINTIMTQFGVSQLEANILMGIILTLLCAVVVGGGLATYGSGSGAGVGAMIGAVVGFSGSSIMGFFPIWILIVVIVLVFAAWFMFRGRDE
jgi:hypothetical protein